MDSEKALTERRKVVDARLIEEDLTEVKQPTSLLIAQFFLFPLVIIGICVGIFLLFGYITYDQKTPQEYLDEIRTGSGNRRWQAAFELSSIVTSSKEQLKTSNFASDVLAVYRSARDEDPRVRQFLATTLGQIGDKQAVPDLIAGLTDIPRELYSANAEVQNSIYTLLALGSIGDNAAVPAVLQQIKHEDPAVRQVAAFVLGALKDPRATRDLQIALNDSKDVVRWYAAISLAQLNDDSGTGVLMKLLDRTYVDAITDIRPEDKIELTINAVKSLALLKHEPARETIATLSRNDPNLAVRDASLEALTKF